MMKNVRIKKRIRKSNTRETRKVIPMGVVQQSTIDLIMETILEAYKPEKFKEGVRYPIEIPVQASEVRREYVLGNLCLDQEMVQEYDLFKTKETITEVIMKDFQIESIVMITRY